MEGSVRIIPGDSCGRRYISPDGSERYLVDEALLLEHTKRLGGELADPIKTTVMRDLRAMTTWVLWKLPRSR